MELNRRDLFKSGAAGFLLGFLFRGRLGKLVEQPEVAKQLPSAIVITSMPQHAFRPERLVIAGTVVGTRMVPETTYVPCAACEKRWAELGTDDDTYCETCDDLGGRVVETGTMVEKPVTAVPWSIEEITIGDKAQITQGTAIPGDLFSATAVDSAMLLDTAGEGKAIRIVVRYTGDKPGGEEFRGALIGTSIDAAGLRTRSVLPISSGRLIVT